MSDGRIIAIWHREKKTTEGESRPTEVFIMSQNRTKLSRYELDDTQAELDFAHGVYPVKMRKVERAKDIAGVHPHHIAWRKIEDDETVPQQLVHSKGKKRYIATEVPAAYDGLKADDTVVLLLGSSGDAMAHSLSHIAGILGEGTQVLRFPGVRFHNEVAGLRIPENSGDAFAGNAAKLALLALARPELFYPCRAPDRTFLQFREKYQHWLAAQEDRVRCQQRLRHIAKDRIFYTEKAGYPEGTIEEAFLAAKATDAGLKVLKAEEAARLLEMEARLGEIPVYTQILAKIDGVGPALAARIIFAIGDIRRFPTLWKLQSYLGVGVRMKLECGDCAKIFDYGDALAVDDILACPFCHGISTKEHSREFPRRKYGETSNWRSDSRKAFFLLWDQFNKRPTTPWGKIYLATKERMRTNHPVEIIVGERRRYSKGDIQIMARWRTIRAFLRTLFRQWQALEGIKPAEEKRHEKQKVA